MSQVHPPRVSLFPFRQSAPVTAALALACALGGCGVDRTVTGSIVEDDVRLRHPIVLASTQTTLDIFPVASGNGLDHVSTGQLRQFGQTYRQDGEGQIQVMLPQGGPAAASAHHALDGIRRELAAGGAKGYISVGSYPVTNPALAAPVRLSFNQLHAKVARPCGEWPTDLASGSSVESWTNRPYWNFGCASQSTLAAQIDNPRDLAGPRAEQPADTAARTRAIQSVRKGSDPGTTWVTKNSTISQIGN